MANGIHKSNNINKNIKYNKYFYHKAVSLRLDKSAQFNHMLSIREFRIKIQIDLE